MMHYFDDLKVDLVDRVHPVCQVIESNFSDTMVRMIAQMEMQVYLVVGLGLGHDAGMVVIQH